MKSFYILLLICISSIARGQNLCDIGIFTAEEVTYVYKDGSEKKLAVTSQVGWVLEQNGQVAQLWLSFKELNLTVEGIYATFEYTKLKENGDKAYVFSLTAEKFLVFYVNKNNKVSSVKYFTESWTSTYKGSSNEYK